MHICNSKVAGRGRRIEHSKSAWANNWDPISKKQKPNQIEKKYIDFNLWEPEHGLAFQTYAFFFIQYLHSFSFFPLSILS
jgi:hypothetical protein